MSVWWCRCRQEASAETYLEKHRLLLCFQARVGSRAINSQQEYTRISILSHSDVKSCNA